MSNGTPPPPEQNPGTPAEAFAERFGHWSIELPPRAAGDSGRIAKAGWSINYRYIVEDGEEWLYVYSSHRMTDDSLIRIDGDGKVESVDGAQLFYSLTDPNAEQEYYEANRRFYERVKALGLL